MPVTLVDRLPLPNLKVYTAGSVALLAAAVYHAFGATSDPAWRANATLQRQEAGGAAADPAAVVLEANITSARNLTEQVVDVMTFMLQEPLCMWTLINMSYCGLAVFACAIQRAVFGALRVAEAQRVKDKLWNYVFYKFIFVFGVVNVQYMDEVLLWCCWFTLVGFLHLLAHLCKDRFEYVSSSSEGGGAGGREVKRLVWLVGGVAGAAAALLAAAAAAPLPAGKHTVAFMAAECVLVLLSSLHVLARHLLQVYEADAAGPLAYYTHLVFDSLCLVVEAGDVVHMVWWCRLGVSLPALVLLLQLRHLLARLRGRLRRHRLYTALANHMSQNYPMASKEEVEKNQDNCAICWEPMKEARKLPCSHLFHNSCLCQWVQQDASCPTCRRALRAAPPAAPRARPLAGLAPLVAQDAPNPPTSLFHFDGSRYVSWLPSFSVEVTRARPPALAAAHLDSMARQVQQLFPQYPLSTLTADLASTRSADVTVNNILEGRLAAPPPPPAPPATPPPAPASPVAPTAPAVTVTALVATDRTQHDPSSVQDMSASGTIRRLRSAVSAPGRDAATSTTHHYSLPNVPYDDHTEVEHTSTKFSMNAGERELQLQRRKEELIQSARRRYLDKLHAAPGPRS